MLQVVPVGPPVRMQAEAAWHRLRPVASVIPQQPSVAGFRFPLRQVRQDIASAPGGAVSYGPMGVLIVPPVPPVPEPPVPPVPEPPVPEPPVPAVPTVPPVPAVPTVPPVPTEPPVPAVPTVPPVPAVPTEPPVPAVPVVPAVPPPAMQVIGIAFIRLSPQMPSLTAIESCTAPAAVQRKVVDAACAPSMPIVVGAAVQV